MSKATREDRAYEKFVRTWPCVVAVALGTPAQCGGPVEFCHLEHRGMGGARVSSLGNGFPACGVHHRSSWAGFHGLGVKTFQRTFQLDLPAICLRLLKYYELGVPFCEEHPLRGLALTGHGGHKVAAG